MNQRAYSTLEIKAATEDGGKRRFSGIASTPETDRMGDIVEPKGAEFKLPLPLLWQHDSRNPIGWITKARVTDAGIEVEGEVASMVDDPESDLGKQLKTYWQYIKSGLVRGLSIGFKAKETARIEGTYGYRIMKWAWLELSAVTIPANEQATILAIKSADLALQAASGHRQLHDGRASALPPGVPGATKNAALRGTQTPTGKGPTMKTAYQELAEFREQRTTKTARMEELQTLAKSAERRLSQEEAAEFDTLLGEVDALDDQIRAKSLEALNGAAARPVSGDGTKAASESRSGLSFVRKADPDDKFKGQAFTRFLIAKAAAFIEMHKGNIVSPADIAKHRWTDRPQLIEYVRAAVAGGGTGSGEWGQELVSIDNRFQGDFVEYLYSKTVFDSLPLRPMPHNVNIKGQDGAATGYWVGESKAIPVSKADFNDVDLEPLEVDALAVCSQRLIRDSSPSAEMWIRDSIVQASAQRVDTTFLSNAAASAGVSPAGILNGLTPLAPSGTDAAAVRADFQSLALPFLAAKNGSGLVHVMTPSMAMALSMLVNALGQTEFPDIAEAGGTLFKRPVFTGDNVTPGDWIVLKPSDIWKIGDTGISVSMSDQATIEMNDAPAGASDTPTAMASHTVSLWQTNSVGFKVTRGINYKIRRAGAVQVLSNAEYGGVVS